MAQSGSQDTIAPTSSPERTAMTTTPQQFGEYLLFRRLTTDGLGETYRAGKIGNQGIERVVLLRLFNGQGIDSDSLWRTIADRMSLHRILQNPHIGDGADVGRVGTTPYVAYEYVSGKNLSELLNQARARSFQIPTEHALFIMERITFGLSAAYSSRHREQRVQHGFLIPENVLLSNEGEVRLIGFESGPGLREFQDVALIRESFGPYLAPEATAGSSPAPTDDVFALGSLLYELLTGKRLMHTADGNYDPLVDDAVLAAEDQPLPPPLRALLKSSLATKQQRIGDVQQWQQAFSRFIAEAQYSPTTFNLAFFMHTLFGGEIEQESVDIEREKATQVDVKALANAQVQEPTPGPSDTVLIPPSQAPGAPGQETEDAAPAAAAPSQYGAAGRKQTNWKLLAPLAILAIGGGLAAAYYMSQGRDAPADELALTETEAAATIDPDASPLDPLAEGDATDPLAVEEMEGGDATDDVAAGAIDTANVDVPPTPDQVEDQIRQLVDDRANLLEARYEEQLAQLREELEAARLAQQEQQAAAAQEPSAATPPVQTAAGQPQGTAPSRQTESGAPVRPQTPAQQQASAPTKPAETPAKRPAEPAETTQQASKPAEPVVKEPAPKPVQVGDLVSPGPGVIRPEIVRQATPRYPPSARRLNKTATVNLRVLVDENGKVLQVESVGERAGFGFDEAAITAARRSDWKPAVKDGVRVKMWVDLKIDFRP